METVFYVRTTTNMNKAFCPHCGNETLKKVAVTLNEDGSVKMHFSKNPKVLNSRGLRVRHTHPRHTDNNQQHDSSISLGHFCRWACCLSALVAVTSWGKTQ